MKTKNVFKYLWIILLAFLLAFFGIMAARGREIHEKTCPEVETARVKTVMSEGVKYTCISKRCVRDGIVYEIYKQKGFFNDNTRVKAVSVETMDIFPEEDMIAITSGIDGSGRTYYAMAPMEGLEDGEAVVIAGK